MYLIYLIIYSNGNPDVKHVEYFNDLETILEYIRQNFPDFEQAGDDSFVKEDEGETKYLIIKEEL